MANTTAMPAKAINMPIYMADDTPTADGVKRWKYAFKRKDGIVQIGLATAGSKDHALMYEIGAHKERMLPSRNRQAQTTLLIRDVVRWQGEE